MKQALGVYIDYKGGGPKDDPFNMQTTQDVLTYFQHLHDTNLEQATPESQEENVDVTQVEINMNAVAVRKLITDLQKDGYEFEFRHTEKVVEVDEGFSRLKKLTYLTLQDYMVKITK